MTSYSALLTILVLSDTDKALELAIFCCNRTQDNVSIANISCSPVARRDHLPVTSHLVCFWVTPAPDGADLPHPILPFTIQHLSSRKFKACRAICHV